MLSLYAASPTIPKAAFGRFDASNNSKFKQLGTAAFGTVATVSLGKSVTQLGGYVGTASSPIGKITPSQVDPFNKRNALPFHAVHRLSLFLFTNPASTSGTVFGSLDK
jgi:hypothetical protein